MSEIQNSKQLHSSYGEAYLGLRDAYLAALQDRIHMSEIDAVFTYVRRMQEADLLTERERTDMLRSHSWEVHSDGTDDPDGVRHLSFLYSNVAVVDVYSLDDGTGNLYCVAASPDGHDDDPRATLKTTIAEVKLLNAPTQNGTTH